MLRRLFVTLTAVVVLLSPVARADFAAGLSAYQNGDYETAFKEFERLAEKGVVLGQTNIGYMYSLGEGVEQDLEKATFWFRKAAENGSTAAQLTMGALAFHGEGMERSSIEAYAWFSIAAVGGQDSANDFVVLLTTQLTSEQLNEARKLSEAYYESFGVGGTISLGDPS